jgi:LmbE family N-acetylglucosaminyl deacetylase
MSPTISTRNVIWETPSKQVKDVGKSTKVNGTDLDIHWFVTKKEEVDTNVGIDELAEIKRKEAEAMAEALGVPVGQEENEDLAAKMQEEIKKSLEQNVMDEKVVGIGEKRF